MADIARLSVVVDAETREAEAGLKRVHTATASLGDRFKASAVSGAAFGAGLLAVRAGTGLLSGAFGGLVGDGIRLNTSMENVTAQLTAMTGDGAKAAEILAQIRKEADTTPFAFEEMARATAGLLPAAKQSGVALQDLVKQAEVLAASHPEQGLEGAAFALREALSGDFTSVVERFDLPRQRLNELKAQGVPAVKAIQTAMKEMGLDVSLVSGLAQTMSGRWSTFQDTIAGIRGRLTAGLFEGLKNGLMTLQKLFDDNAEAVNAFATRIGAAIGGFVADAIPKLMAFGQQALPIVIGAFKTLAGVVGPAAAAISDLVSTGDVGVFADDIREAFGIDLSGFVAPLRAVGDALGVVGQKAEETVTRLGTFFGSLASGETLATAVNKAFGDLIPPGLNPVLDAVDSAVRRVKDGLQLAIDKAPAFVTALGQIATAASEGGATGAVTKLAEQLRALGAAETAGAVERAAAQIGTALSTVQRIGEETAAGLGRAFGASGTSAMNWGQVLDRVFAGAVAAILTPITAFNTMVTAGQVFQKTNAAVTEAINKAWADATSVIGKTATDLAIGLTTTVDGLRRDLGDLWSSISRAATDIWDTISRTVSRLAGEIAADVKGKVDGLRRDLGSAWSTISGAADAAWQGVKTLVVAWAEGLKNAVMTIISGPAALSGLLASAWSAISGAAGTAWDGINKTVVDLAQLLRIGVMGYVTGPDGLVGSLSSAWNSIRGTAAGVWESIRSDIAGVWNSIKGDIDSKIGAIKNAINGLIGRFNDLSFRVSGFSVKIPSVEVPGVGTVGGGTLSWGGIDVRPAKVPMLADGAVATRPTLAMLAEGGRPEAVVPLDRAAEFGFGRGRGDIHLHITGAFYGSLQDFAREIKPELARLA